ncbi:probable inactive purple acid phosphatase 28 [Phalaenopsis equestris]|uniref:probable inactive purple acid phosphatase 28 n=1 Tax=Phalaenopsis equestris TaxID=78828 RepID=UPI0009E4F9C2|nr:probable inactive purple acid phosphatase 28 [Phalaenopsis equestris]
MTYPKETRHHFDVQKCALGFDSFFLELSGGRNLQLVGKLEHLYSHHQSILSNLVGFQIAIGKCRGLYGGPTYAAATDAFLLFLPLPFYLFLWDPIAIGRPTVRLKRTAELPLRFRRDGVFKILQVADMHYGNGEATRCKDVRAAEAAGCSDLDTTITYNLQAIFQAPALTFFHIPFPEVRQLWYTKIVGQYQEGVACSIVNSGVLKTLRSMGDVKASFIGHDHLNDFCGNLDGIWLCYGGGFGYHAYGRASWPGRARVISAQLKKGMKDWLGVETIRTWKRLDDEVLSQIDEQVLWENRTGE